MLWAFFPSPLMRNGGRTWRAMMPFCIWQCREVLYSLCLQPSLTHRRLFKIMCRGFFFTRPILPLEPAAEGRPGSFSASLDWLPNGTIGYDPSPAVPETRQRHSSHHPSSLAVTDGLAGITTRRCAFSPPPSLIQQEKWILRWCLCSCMFLCMTQRGTRVMKF